jgi:hypothetical protein
VSKDYEVWRNGRLVDASVTGMLCVHHVGLAPGMWCSECSKLSEPQPGTLEYAERMADQHGDFDDAAVEDGMDNEGVSRVTEPHAYVIEVLVNAGSITQFWKTYDDFEFERTDDRDSAEGYRELLISDGYSPEHLRVVGLVTL